MPPIRRLAPQVEQNGEPSGETLAHFEQFIASPACIVARGPRHVNDHLPPATSCTSS